MKKTIALALFLVLSGCGSIPKQKDAAQAPIRSNLDWITVWEVKF